MTKIILIAAHGLNYGIGVDNKLPWSCKVDMEHFKTMTTGHIVIMGRKTADGFLSGHLKDRYNIVITSNPTGSPYRFEASSPELAMEHAKQVAIERNCAIFVIGGAQTYESFKGVYTDMVLSEIPVNVEVDSHLPKFAQTTEGFTLNEANTRTLAWGSEKVVVKHFEAVPNV